MATKALTKSYTFTSTAPVSVATLIDMEDKTWISSVTLRSGLSNVGLVTWSDGDLDPGGYLQAEEAATLEFDGQTLAGTVFICGATNDVVYITVGISSEYFDHMEL